MLGALLLFTLAHPSDQISLSASESVWVYSHASDPSGDQFLRVWGADGKATPEGQGDGEDWSYGYLKWDVRSLPKATPKAVVLSVYNVNPAGFGDAEAAAKTPLQARPLVGSFVGKDWEFSKSYKIHPDLAATVFGSAVPKTWGDSKDPIIISIDLLKGPGKFLDALMAAENSPSHELCLALTSAIDPSTGDGGGGKGGVYKLYSAAAGVDAKYRPMLIFEY